MQFAATPPYDGTLGRYYKVPASLAYLLPENLSLEDGAMVRLESPQYSTDLRTHPTIL